MSKSGVESVGQGRVWTADDALENGLIDGLGDIDAAIDAAAELANLAADDYGLKHFEQKLDPAEQLMLDLMSRARGLGMTISTLNKPRPSIERVADVLDDALSPLTRFNDPRGIYSHCFCVFE